jgi:hypothetical protein
MNHLRVQVVKTDRTDLVCIACGGFGASQPMLAIVAPEQPSSEAHAGVHRRCVHRIKARRRSGKGSAPPPAPAGGTP